MQEFYSTIYHFFSNLFYLVILFAEWKTVLYIYKSNIYPMEDKKYNSLHSMSNKLVKAYKTIFFIYTIDLV